MKSKCLRLIVRHLGDERAESSVVDRLERNVLELKKDRTSRDVRLGGVRGNRKKRKVACVSLARLRTGVSCCDIGLRETTRCQFGVFEAESLKERDLRRGS